MTKKIQPEDVIVLIGVVPLLAAFILGMMTPTESLLWLVLILMIWSLSKC